MKRFLAPRDFGVLTEAGKRASAAFDPIEDDPAINCDPGGPVRFWINVNEPFEIKREQSRVVVDHRFMDSQRVMHLTRRRARRRAARDHGLFDGALRRRRARRHAPITSSPEPSSRAAASCTPRT